MSLDPDAIAVFTAFNRKLFDGMLKAYSDGDSTATAEIFKSLTAGAVYDTSRWLGIQEEYYRKHVALYEKLTSHSAAESAQAVAVPGT